MTENEKKIRELRLAIGLVEDVITLVDETLQGTGLEDDFRAYGRYGLDDLLGNGNPHNPSLFDLISDFKNTEVEK